MIPLRRRARRTPPARLGLALALAGSLALGTAAPAHAETINLRQCGSLSNQATYLICSLPDGGVTLGEGTLGDRSDSYDVGWRMKLQTESGSDWVGSPDNTAELTDTDLTFQPKNIGGLDVDLTYTVIPGTSTLRLLLRMTNSSTEPRETGFETTSDLGSDGGTVIQRTSSGDLRFLNDRWAITSDSFPTTNGPVVSTVLEGTKPRGLIESASAGSTNGFTDYAARFDVPAESTRYLMFFTRLDKSPKKAFGAIRAFDRRSLDETLLAGLSPEVRKAILNWGIKTPS